MPTSITFETSTISAAIRNAARIAPTTRGMAFDHAAGLYLMVDPANEFPLVIQSTNLEMFYTEWVTALEADGPATAWRLPSMALDKIIGSLPIGAGKTVTFTETDKLMQVEVTSGRGLRARFNGINRHREFPTWIPFDPDLLTEVPALGGQIKLVEWAAASGGSAVIMSGIHLDGEVAIATDATKAAIMPCLIEKLDKSVTIPPQTLSLILKESASAKLAVVGETLCVMPDAWTQIKVRTFGETYPAAKIRKSLGRELDGQIETDRDELLALINRVAAIDMTNRTPCLNVWFGNEEIACFMESGEIGLLRDIVDCPGQALHKRVKYMFNPKNFIDLLVSAPEKKIKLGYGQHLTPMISLSCGDYQAWIARMVPPKERKDP